MRTSISIWVLACAFVCACTAEQNTPSTAPSTQQHAVITPVWTKVEPGGDTICSRGTPFHFWVRNGISDKLLIYFLGGGACWDAKSCNTDWPYFDDDFDEKKSPQALNGLFDFHNPENPFLDWNVVFIPYCTGDIHWGANTHTYPEDAAWPEVTIHHNGFVNAMSAVDWTYDNFENPSRIFVAGDSAGAYGSIFFSPYLMEHYAQSEFIYMGDSGAGVSTPSFIEGILDTWNVVPNISPLQADIVDLASNAPAELTIPTAFESVAKLFPQHKFVQLNTVEDKTQKFFLKSIGGDADEWRGLMEASIASIDQNTSNFSYYTGWGDSHVLTLGGIFYQYQVNGVRLRDYVADLANGVDVGNVQCVDCETEELHEFENPLAEDIVMQPYQDADFRAFPQGSSQCGPTALYTVFHYYNAENVYTGMHCDRNVDLSTALETVTKDTAFCQWVNGGSAFGTSWSQLKYALMDLRLDCERLFAVELQDKPTDLDTVLGQTERMARLDYIHDNYLIKKRPVIIHLSRVSATGHYLVLIGYDKSTQTVYYADPNKGRIQFVKLDDFIKTEWYRAPTNPLDANVAYWDGEWMGFYPTEPENTAVHDSPRDTVLGRYGIERALIVNGDDFGLTSLVNQGITEGLDEGLLTSSSIQAPADGADDAYARALNRPERGFGVHLTLTRPKWGSISPISDRSLVKSLVDWQGRFRSDVFWAVILADESEIEIELRAQIEDALASGVPITHLDCHDGWCHESTFGLDFGEYDTTYLDLAQEYQLPVRWTFPDGERLLERGLVCADKIITPDAADTLDEYEARKSSIMKSIRGLGRGKIGELVLHPQAGEVSNGQDFRVLDYQLAQDPELLQFLEDEKITLIDYRVLKEMMDLM